MANTEASPSSALVAELSLTFRDELTASIQSAFGVAVGIAVVEVTKLVGQALQDVRDQMHETLRDNKSLKARLRATETELRTVRSRLAEARRQNRAVPVTGGQIPAEPKRDRRSPPDIERQVECLPDVKQKYEQRIPGEANLTESFCEIREDGSVCTQDLKPDLMEERSTATQMDEVKDIKDDHHSTQEKLSHFSQVHAGDPGFSASVMDGSLSHEDGCALPEVAVKVEDTEACGGPAPGSLSAQEGFVSDCLSLAQSRLLEDWRPEPLQLQSCPSDSYVGSASGTLESSLFPVDIPELDFLTSGAASQPDTFPTPLSQRDASSLSNRVPQPGYSSHNSGPSQLACKLCGQSFHLQEDLRRHRSLMHPKQPSHLHKSPKRNLFPPGRSPYHCSQCGRDFNRMEHLKIHQRIHTGERPYACTVCSARFRHSWALTRHFRIHTGEKPYTCAQCGKTFRNCGGLRFHQRSHARGQVA